MNEFIDTLEASLTEEQKQDICKLVEDMKKPKSATINAFAGKRHTPESRIRMSVSRMGNTNCVGRILSQETRHKISVAKMGHKHTPVGHIVSEETKRKIGAANRGRIPTTETRIKMSKSQKRRYERDMAHKYTLL